MGLTGQCPHLWPRGVGAELRVLLSSLIPRNASTRRPPVSISEEGQSALLWSKDYAEGESRTPGGGVPAEHRGSALFLFTRLRKPVLRD